ncbi:MAG: hypothetical protein ACE5F3_06655 [Mariprofundaceae bacterium]
MIPSLLLLLSILGLNMNIGLAGLLQPDWTLAMLLAALLAHRGSWPWVFPGIFTHDTVLHWSVWVCLPIVLLLPFIVAHMDGRLGPGLPQRLVLMLAATFPLLWWGWSLEQWLLTILLVIPVWHLLARIYARPA